MSWKLHIYVFENVIYVTDILNITFVTAIVSYHWYIKIAIHTPEEIFIVAAWEVRLLVGWNYHIFSSIRFRFGMHGPHKINQGMIISQKNVDWNGINRLSLLKVFCYFLFYCLSNFIILWHAKYRSVQGFISHLRNIALTQ